jgi:hypothetical protein
VLVLVVSDLADCSIVPLFPVHILFALSQSAPLLLPVKWLQRIGAPFPADDALLAITLLFGVLGFIHLPRISTVSGTSFGRQGIGVPQRPNHGDAVNDSMVLRFNANLS